MHHDLSTLFTMIAAAVAAICRRVRGAARRAPAFGFILTFWGLSAPVAALDCAPVEGREAVSFSAEVAGKHGFLRPFGAGWNFTLVAVPDGWRFAVLNAAGDDLSWATPPLHGPNARDLAGWHFRNADNTGPNMGDVNAPQALRLFVFFPDTGEMAGVEAKPDREPEGRGMVEILDYGLADLMPGQVARMVYVKFSACITWPEGIVVEASIPDEVVEQMRACGLPGAFDLVGYLSVPSLSADFDGDDVLDLAAPIMRRGDGKRGVAICRAGSKLDVIGISGPPLGELHPDYFDHIDYWQAEPRGPVGQGAVDGAPPTLVGDAILLAKSESSSVLLYWDGKAWASYWQGD